MNSDVHPLVVALVLALAVAAIIIWTWGSGVAAGFGGPAEMVTGPNGHHYIQIQNHLVEHNAEGAYLGTHNLEALDVELFLGSFAFFSNGDVLLRRGPDPRSFVDNLRAFQRQSNQDSIRPESIDSGLFRCSLDTLVCERFGAAGVDFKAAYGVHIDWTTDEVYVSDTTRHVLRKFSSDGTELAEAVGGFKFPNQLLLRDGQLLIADTNNHVIRIVEPQSSSFAEPIDSKNIVPARAESAEQRWPSHFAHVDEEWWVNNMKTGMNLGGLYVFDQDWRFSRNISLPRGADPISILVVGSEVWVSDWNNDLVHRLSFSGKALANLESAGLEAILAASRLERQKYSFYSYAGISLVVFVLLVLLVRAFAVSMNKDPVSSPAVAVSVSDSDPLYFEPDEKVLRRMAMGVRAAGLLLLVANVLLVYVLLSFGKFEVGIPLIGFVVGMLSIIVMIIWVNRANHGTFIRLNCDTLTLRDHNGRESNCPIRDVRYDDTSIATDSAVVFMGRPMAQVYDAKAVKERLMPRLVDAQKVNPLSMMLVHIQLWHPQGVITVVAFVGLVIYGVVRLVAAM